MSTTDVVTIGETMLRLTASRIGPLAHSPSMELGIGGAESNVAIGLRRLGTTVTWMSRLGADSGGDLVVRELKGEGVHVIAPRDSDAPTGLMLKERRTAESVAVTYHRAGSAASGMTPDDLDLEAIARTRLLHLTGITPALSETCRDTVRAAIAHAKSCGVTVSFDLNFRSRLWTTAAASAFYRSILADVDLVFAGDDEAAIAVGDAGSTEDLARALQAQGPGTAVLKRGAQGALVLADAQLESGPAVAITPVDTVGAGDAFVAGYLAEHLAGGTPREALALGLQTGAFACLSGGDWEGAARRTDLPLLSSGDPVIR